jgi:hypothetical protein
LASFILEVYIFDIDLASPLTAKPGGRTVHLPQPRAGSTPRIPLAVAPEQSAHLAAIARATAEGLTVESANCVGDTYVQRALRNLTPFGAKEDIARVESDLNTRFGMPPSSSDVAWGLYNATVARHNDASDLTHVFHHMAAFLHDEGRDWFPMAQKAAQMEGPTSVGGIGRLLSSMSSAGRAHIFGGGGVQRSACASQIMYPKTVLLRGLLPTMTCTMLAEIDW